MKIKHLSLRIDDQLLKKLHVVADYNGRSANSELIMLIKKHVKEYETKNGSIKFE
jgi:metal-responsive CopG/Arc/MetJ family transcriptional regulator